MINYWCDYWYDDKYINIQHDIDIILVKLKETKRCPHTLHRRWRSYVQSSMNLILLSVKEKETCLLKTSQPETSPKKF